MLDSSVDISRIWRHVMQQAGGIRHCARVCRAGYKIGPLFADNDELAALLFLELRSKIAQGERIFVTHTFGVTSFEIG